MGTVVNENSQVYYSGQYWNDFPIVFEYMCENITGNKTKWWMQDFFERFCHEPLEHGLILNCGNGWVERQLIDMNIVKKITAFDYSIDLLSIAEKERGDRPIFYFQADANKVDFDENQFDLIVNVAALHHVQYINRLCYILCKAIKENGIFINYDYIGPRRNQYSFWHWYHIKRVNNTLPSFIKKAPMKKPHLPSMLYFDPTEAIHSDLIMESVARYFEIFERHDTGGGIAYEILTNNHKLKNIPVENLLNLNPFINKILAMDKRYTDSQKVPPMFSYFLAKPNKQALVKEEMVQHFQEIENRREQKSEKKERIYSDIEYLRMKTHAIHVKFIHSRIAQVLRRNPFLKRFVE